MKISALKIRKKYPYFWQWFLNILVATVWCYYAHQNLMRMSTTRFLFLNIALLLRNTGLTFVFLLRRQSKLTSESILDWILALTGTFIAYLYETAGAKPVFPTLQPALYIVMVAAAFLSAIGVINLGRSFGIVPANRGIQTKGFYALVRHPLYSLYIFHDIAWNLNCFSVHNVCIFVMYCLITYGRARCEEKILLQDPLYREYASKTRYMFLPGVI